MTWKFRTVWTVEKIRIRSVKTRRMYMKEIKAFPKRKWVIKAGIGFLVVMGLLTFFSNTIMNWSLPQVTVVSSTGGSMSSAIKGTGTIEAITQSKITAQGVRKIDQVFFGQYEQVQAGDVIATLVEATDAEKEELKAAEDALKALEKQKITEEMQAPVYDYSMDERGISDAQETLNAANANLTSAQGKPAAISAAQAEVNTAQGKIDTQNNDLLTLDSKRVSQAQMAGNAQDDLTAAQDELAAVSQAQTALDQANSALAVTEQQIKDKNAALKTANASLEAANVKLSAAQALPSVPEASEAVKMAQRSVDDLKKALSDKKKNDAITQQIASMDDADKKKALEDAQKKVDELTALAGESSIAAPKAGIISTISISSGSETVKGDILVAIDVIEDGFKVAISFTTEQASQMQIGMGARFDGWGGAKDDAIIVSMKPDSTDPRNKKTVIFKINDTENTYWLSSGQSVTLSLNNSTKNYMCIVPLSSIHEESGETFVYTIKTKNSPLGDRYIAVKVPVTILAKDDLSAAIDPSAFSNGYASVITETNDKSFKSGDQVRLADV